MWVRLVREKPLGAIGAVLVLWLVLMAIWPGIALSLAVFGFNMLRAALRDVLDPRLRGAGGRFQAAT